MEPRKPEYSNEDQKQLLALEQLVAQEFTLLSQKIKSDGFKEVAEQNSQNKDFFDILLEKSLVAFSKVNPTIPEIIPFESIKNIQDYFNELLGKIEKLSSAPAIKATPLYLWSKDNPTHLLFKEYIIACKKLTEILFIIKNLNTVTTNPKLVDLKLRSAQTEAEKLYLKLPAYPEKEETFLNTEWGKQAQNRNIAKLTVHIPEQEQRLKENAADRKRSLLEKIDSLVTFLSQEQEGINRDREFLITRFHALIGNVNTIASEINNLVAIKEERNKALSSEQCNRRYSEDGVDELKRSYQNYCFELKDIHAELLKIRKEAGEAKQKKQAAILQLEADIADNQAQVATAFGNLIRDVKNINQVIYTNHHAFLQKEGEMRSALRHYMEELAKKLQDFPTIAHVDACKNALNQLQTLSREINQSKDQLKQVCSAQNTGISAHFWLIAEGKKWHEIGNYVGECLSQIYEGLNSYISSTKDLKRLLPIKPFKIRENLENRQKEFQNIIRVLDEDLQTLQLLSAQITVLARNTEEHANAENADLGELVTVLSERTNEILHFDFINAIVIEPNQCASLEKKLAELKPVVDHLDSTAEKARKFIAALEKAQREIEQADGLYNAMLPTLEQSLIEYTKKLEQYKSERVSTELEAVRKQTEEAKNLYAQKKVIEAAKAVDTANQHMSKVKRMVANLQEYEDKATIKSKLILLKTCAADLTTHTALFHGFESKKQEINEFMNEKELEERYSNLPQLLQDVNIKLCEARNLQTRVKAHLAEKPEAPDADIKPVPISIVSDKEKANFFSATLNFFKENWKPILIGLGIGVLVAGTVVGLTFAGIVSFGTIPATVGAFVALGVTKGVSFAVVSTGATLLGGIAGSVAVTALTKAAQFVSRKIRSLFNSKQEDKASDLESMAKLEGKSSQATILVEMRNSAHLTSSKTIPIPPLFTELNKPVIRMSSNHKQRHSARGHIAVQSLHQQDRRSLRGQ